jgi:hypothetical protein
MKKRSTQLLVLSGLMLAVFGWTLTSTHLAAAQQGPPTVPVNIVSPIPVPVSDAAHGIPFTTSGTATNVGGPPEVVFTNPLTSDQLLVIQQVSAKLSACAASSISFEDLRLVAGTTKFVWLAPDHLLSTFANAFITNEELNFVVAPGETIKVETEQLAFSSACGPLSMKATISGVVIPK